MIKVPMSRDAICGWGCTTQRWREASGAGGGVISLLPVELTSQVATHKENSRGAEDVARLIKFLARMHESLHKLDVDIKKQEDQRFKVTLSYMKSWRPARLREALSRKTTQTWDVVQQ